MISLGKILSREKPRNQKHAQCIIWKLNAYDVLHSPNTLDACAQ